MASHRYEITSIAATIGGFVTAKIVVSVMEGSVVAKIVGGTRRQLLAGLSIRVDASSSYDENFSTGDGSISNTLSYRTLCFQVLPVYNIQCPLRLVIVSSGIIEASVVSRASLYSRSKVIVIVSDRLNSQRMAEVGVEIDVVDSGVDDIRLSKLGRNTKKINPSEKLILQGVVSYSPLAFDSVRNRSLYLSISSNNQSLDIASRSYLSPMSYYLSPSLYKRGSSLQTFQFNFIFDRYSFTHFHEYTFELRLSSSLASLTLEVNEPPRMGRLAVVPNNGVELETIFQYFAIGC